MLSARDIRFRYSARGSWLLDHASIDLAPSEIVGIRGPSGTGKTTLAKILAGYLKPASGLILVDDSPLRAIGYHPVQLVFQHPELTINPYFRIGKALAEAGEEALVMARGLGVEAGWLSRFPHELSGGELQRVALARALGPKTRYLIADEPTAMLDAITQAEIWRLLLRIVQERKIGLLAISHDVALLERVSHRIVCLTD
jgi:peptide/nickel transport system ATP-binding protein